MNTIPKIQRILPPRLKKGDTIGVIAPADPVAKVCPPEIVERGYAYLRKKGFGVEEGNSMRSYLGHTAGSIDVRIDDIHNFLGVMTFNASWHFGEDLTRTSYSII